jgi:hypothetical protein
MPPNIEQSLRKAQKIKLSGGVVGKTCAVLVTFCISVGTAASFSRSPSVVIVCVSLMFVFSLVTIWRLISFAERNPQAAILEGAEFLIHQQISMGMKDAPNLPSIDRPKRAGRTLPNSSHQMHESEDTTEGEK